MAIYAVSLSALFGTSALYHRVNWNRPQVRQWMRRLDHSMIFFLIAGTYTPFALLVLHGTLAMAILAVVWIGAIAGAIVEMVWIDHPKWASALIYMSLGWVAAAAFPELWTSMGVAGTLLVAFGGLLYTAGAVVYATQRPNPNPAVFGYHEVFHLFVIAAAIAHYAAIAFFALPEGLGAQETEGLPRPFNGNGREERGQGRIFEVQGTLDLAQPLLLSRLQLLVARETPRVLDVAQQSDQVLPI